MSSRRLLELLITEPTDECPDESGSRTLLEELRRSRDRERLLTEKVKEMEENIVELLPFENTLKQKDSEVERLESKTKEQGQQVLMLMNDLERDKTKLMLEKKNKAELKAQYERKISDLEGERTSLQKLYDGEKVTDRKKVQQYKTRAAELLRNKTETQSLQNEMKKLQQELEEQKEIAAAQKTRAKRLKDELILKTKEYEESVAKLEAEPITVQTNVQKKKVHKEPVDKFTMNSPCKFAKCIALRRRLENDKKKHAESTEKKILNLQSLIATLKKKIIQQTSMHKKAIAEKDVITGQLAKAQENIKLNSKTISEQNDNLKKQEKEFQTMSTELSKLKMEHSSVVKLLEKAQKKAGTSKNILLVKEASFAKK
ncbi:unnamed protein product [Lampetra planeri]